MTGAQGASPARAFFSTFVVSMLGKRTQFDGPLWLSIDSIEASADFEAEEWFEHHSRPPPLKKHLQAGAKKRRTHRIRMQKTRAPALAGSAQ